MNIILGPPGTGKTQRLLDLVEEYLSKGTRPEDIGFIAFTRKAANEAKDRAIKRFGFNDRNLQYFRTIHSLAFRQLSLSKIQVMQRENYRELGQKLSINITGSVNMDEGSASYGMSEGDRYIFFEGLARARMVDLRSQWEMANEDMDWWELDRVARGLRKYKEANGLVDYTDMLELYYKQGYVPKLKVLFIDEAQDLSKLQWLALDSLIKKTEVVYVAGDDDQCIFAWAGSDVDHFVNLNGSSTVLDHSFRVPGRIHGLATELASQIKNRRTKNWKSKDGDMGAIMWHDTLETLPLETGEWLLLARNGYMLKEYEDFCMRQGFSYEARYWGPLNSPALTAIIYWEQLRKGETITLAQFKKVNAYLSPEYQIKDMMRIEGFPNLDMGVLKTVFGLKTTDIWHKVLGKISADEREYFIAARRRGERLLGKPRIRISTIHGAKGGESENVALMTDLAPRTYNEMNNDFDNELRVFYVGVTRAKQELHLIQPKTNMYFSI